MIREQILEKDNCYNELFRDLHFQLNSLSTKNIEYLKMNDLLIREQTNSDVVTTS